MNYKKVLALVFVFLISMAYLESAVVVYLRMIYYPAGFQFPLQLMPPAIYFIEAGRELATIIMLAAIGWLAGKSLTERIFYFLFSFGVWDIFYYVWLAVLLRWPASLFENDILFLIPVPWVGPVIAPVIVSLTFIVFSVLGIILLSKGYILRVKNVPLLLVVAGLCVILTSFLWNTFTTDLLKDPDPAFQWGIFLIGEALFLAGVYLFFRSAEPAGSSTYNIS